MGLSHDTLRELPEEESRSTRSQATSQSQTGEQHEQLSEAQQQQKRDEENFEKNQQHQRDVAAKHNERMRKVKNKKPLWGVGGVFPTEESEAEKRGRQESGDTKDGNNHEILNAAADAVFSRGKELGYQQALQGHTQSFGTSTFGSSYSDRQPPSQHTKQAGDYINFPGTSPGQQRTPLGQVGGVLDDNRSNMSSKTPFGQVGGVLEDNRSSQSARPLAHQQPSKSRFTSQHQQHSYYKEMADRELGHGTTQGKEDGQVGGIIDGHKGTPAADQDRNLSRGKSQDFAQGGGTGQIGDMENRWLDEPAVQETYENPDEPIYNYWFNIREYMREPLAEMLGTCIFMIIGSGASCQTVVYTKSLTAAYTNLNWGYGVGVMTGVYISGGISGGHLNPAITLFLAVFRGFPWKLLWKYWIAQILGAFLGSFIVYGMYCDNLNAIDPRKTVSTTGTASLFPTVPDTTNTSVGLAVYQEIAATGVLTASVLALGDRDNTPPGASLGAFILALIIMAIGTSLGALSGYAMNPARDLGPRIMLSCVGYGKELWTHNKFWWLIGPICGSFGGSILGALAYDVCIYSGLGSPVNFTSKQWRRLINPSYHTHNMVKAGLERQQRDRMERQMQREIEELEQKKGDKAV